MTHHIAVYIRDFGEDDVAAECFGFAVKENRNISTIPIGDVNGKSHVVVYYDRGDFQ